jgi:hypothetical protein
MQSMQVQTKGSKQTKCLVSSVMAFAPSCFVGALEKMLQVSTCNLLTQQL